MEFNNKYQVGDRVYLNGQYLYGTITEVLAHEDTYVYFIDCEDGTKRICVPEDQLRVPYTYGRYYGRRNWLL